MYAIVVIVTAVIAHVSCTDCPAGWVAGEGASCYLFARDRTSSFTEAEHYCRQHHNSHLIEVETMKENMFIKDLLRAYRTEHHWLALTDEHTEGIWVWFSTGTQTTYFDWGPGEPNNTGNEDCAVFDYRSDYRWTDAPCGNKYEPLCEMRVETEAIIG